LFVYSVFVVILLAMNFDSNSGLTALDIKKFLLLPPYSSTRSSNFVNVYMHASLAAAIMTATFVYKS